jgi:hypothetical protein
MKRLKRLKRLKPKGAVAGNKIVDWLDWFQKECRQLPGTRAFILRSFILRDDALGEGSSKGFELGKRLFNTQHLIPIFDKQGMQSFS